MNSEVSEYNEILIANPVTKQPQITTQIIKNSYSRKNRDIKNILINKSLKSKKRKIKHALIKSSGWTTTHLVSSIVTYIWLSSMVLLGYIWMYQNSRTTNELHYFSNVNYAIGMKFFSLSEIFHYTIVLNTINKGWKVAQNFTPEVEQDAFANEIYQRLVTSFIELDFFESILTNNLNKFSIAETLLDYNNQPRIKIWWNENITSIRTINQCTTELKAMSLSIIDHDATVITEDDTNIAYILQNSNKGIISSLELEEKFVKEKIVEVV